MSDRAPFCNITGVKIEGNPQLPGLQAIPRATDLQSLIRAVNTLTHNFNVINNFLTNPGPNVINNIDQGGKAQKPPVYQEVRSARVTREVTITDPDSGAEFTFNQIDAFTFADPRTGNKFSWRR